MSKRVIIIGAGYGGMALANLLGKAGWQVDVYEKNSAAGGRLNAFRDTNFIFDTGPSWYLMPEVFEQYYQLFGLSASKRLRLMRLRPGYKVYFDHGDPFIMHGDVAKDVELFEMIEAGAGRRLKEYVDRSSRIYTRATQHFLYNAYDSVWAMLRPDTLRHLLPLATLALMPLDRYVSRYFRDQRLKQILEYHMVFLGNSPFQAPAVYSLMSYLDFRSGVYYPRRGMMSLVNDMKKISRHYAVTYHYESPVKKIIVNNSHASGIELSDGSIHEADVIISNADLHHTETQLLEPAYQTYPETYWQHRQPGPGALVISLGLKGTLPQLLHHTLYFVNDWADNFSSIYRDKKIPQHASMYICNPTKTDASLAPSGHENIFVLVPLPAGIPLSETETNELADRVLIKIAEVIGCADLTSRIVTKHILGPNDYATQYNAWQYNAFGGESHLLTQSVGFRTNNKSKRVDNLYYVGAGTQPGIGLPMCLISAELAYKRIMNLKKSGPLAESDIDTPKAH